jgi:hypothetical protein
MNHGILPPGNSAPRCQATAAGVISSASLFFRVLTRLLTGVATMWVSGYCRSSLNGSSGGGVSHASEVSLPQEWQRPEAGRRLGVAPPSRRRRARTRMSERPGHRRIAAPGGCLGELLHGRVDGGELWRDALGPVGDEAPVHQRTGALAFLVQPDDGGGGNRRIGEGENSYSVRRARSTVCRVA